MISRNVKPTYTQHGIRYYALFIAIQGKRGNTFVDAHNLYIFDQEGYCWFQMLSIDKDKVVRQMGKSFLLDRFCYEIDEPMQPVRYPQLTIELE